MMDLLGLTTLSNPGLFFLRFFPTVMENAVHYFF